MKRVSVFRTNKSEAGYFSSLKLIGLTPTFLQTAAAALLANCAISFRGYFCAKARAAMLIAVSPAPETSAALILLAGTMNE